MNKCLIAFAEALCSGKFLMVSRNGKWHEGGFAEKLLFSVAYFKKIRLRAICNHLLSMLEEEEANSNLSSVIIKAVTIGIEECKLLANEAIYKKLFLAFLAYGYRTKQQMPIFQRQLQVHSQEFVELYHRALEWKMARRIFKENFLTDDELQNIEMLASYIQYRNLLLSDKEIFEEAMQWSIQNRNPIEALIEFPATSRKLIAAGLDKRIGRLKDSGLKILQKNGVKILALPFEGKYFSILNPEAKITFRGQYTLSIMQIFEVFAKKEFYAGNLEYLQGGITNWSVHHLGYWDEEERQYQRIDLNKHNWWENLPAFEILSVQEVEARYSTQLKGLPWIVAASATREFLNLNLENTHAFLEVAIPQGMSYAIYNFGKFGFEYPLRPIEKLTRACIVQTATIAYPDENVFYSQRQTVYHPFILTEGQGRRVLESIRRDMELSRGGNLIYQIHSENCAKWTHDKLEEELGEQNLPDMYRLSMWETEPTGVLGAIFQIIRNLPKSFRLKTLTALHFPFNTWKGVWVEQNGQQSYKALVYEKFWSTGVVYLPALLHHKKANGTLAVVVHACVLTQHIWKIAKKDPLALLKKTKITIPRFLMLSGKQPAISHFISLLKSLYLSAIRLSRERVYPLWMLPANLLITIKRKERIAQKN